MRVYNLLFVLLCLGLVSGCKSDATGKPAAEQAESATPSTTQEGNASQPQGNETQSAGHDYTFLTHQIFHIQAAIVPGKDIKEQPYKGHWIDFLPNGDFHYGKHKEQLYSGTWAYNHDAEVLNMQPSGGKEKPSEWKVLHNEQMVVLMGTSTYGNNGIQMQLIRHAEMPE